MTEPLASSAGLDLRRKRLLFRARHRGMHELDVIVGRFADERLAGLDAGAVEAFERLLDAPEPDLYAWLMGTKPRPPGAQGELVSVIAAFAGSGAAARGA
ncbi:MAG: succinate dehydrogenase assembly factor 2 [Bauldia sp.]